MDLENIEEIWRKGGKEQIIKGKSRLRRTEIYISEGMHNSAKVTTVEGNTDAIKL